MFLSRATLSFMLLALTSVDASPTHFGIAKTLHVSNSKHANALYNNQLGKRDDTILIQRANKYYCATLITSSGSTFKVAVDTASAYTWVGARADNPYLNGFASYATGVTTRIDYASASVKFVGETYDDTIALGALIIHSQGIGIPREVSNFPSGVDGVLGLGPTILTAGMASYGKLIPTVVDHLYSQGTISSPLFGVYFIPQNLGSSGLLSFGYIRETVLTSDVRYVPITKTVPAGAFWGVDAASLPITIASDAFYAYQAATGGTLFFGRLVITQDQYNTLQPLSILIGGQSYDLSPNAQIWARSSSNGLIVLSVQSEAPGSAIAFSLGVPFFQRYYVVFNSSSKEIGLASHIHTDSTTN